MRISSSLHRRKLTRWLLLGAGMSFFTIMLAAESTSYAAAPKSIIVPTSQHIIGVSNEGPNGNIWILEKKATNKTVQEINAITRKVIFSESVSTKASSVAQSSTGNLIVGTASGKTSAVVVYGPTGKFQFAVPVNASVVSVSSSPTGGLFYAIEQTKRSRTLFVFDNTRKGFNYSVDPRTIGMASIGSGQEVWLLQSNGVLKEMSLIPEKLIKTASVNKSALAIASVYQSDLVFVLTAGKSRKVIAISPSGARATISVPRQSTSIGLTAQGRDLVDAVTNAIAGEVVIVPL